MKINEKNKAIILRKQGMSMGEIAETLGVAKSSVSYWVCNVELTQKQRVVLNKNGHSIDAIEKRRITRMTNTRMRRADIMTKAGYEVQQLQKDPLWCIGVALYWGEGGKTQQVARLSNSDPWVIKIMMRFFERYSNFHKDKYRAHVHTYSHKNAPLAVDYWSKISGIPKARFYKTYVKQSSASKKKRETLPYGTLQIYLHETTFFFRLMGWIDKLKEMGEK
jgi:hypothetical protein